MDFMQNVDLTQDPEFKALVEEFAKRLSVYMEELQQARTAGDLEGTLDATHRLAGAAGAFGFAEIGSIAKACERRLRNGASLIDTAQELDGLVQNLRKAAA